MYLLYNLLLLLAAFFALPYFAARVLLTGKYRKSLGQKLGFLPAGKSTAGQGGPRVWFHAVSVGEVAAARPIIEAFRSQRPDARIILSTGTETGQEVARKNVPCDLLIYYPLDIPWVVKRVLDQVRPDLFVTTETELWPNFFRSCAKRKIALVMVNGRISPRSFHRYLKTRFFWQKIINNYQAVGVISATHADRFARLGLSCEKIQVLGNAKYDSLAQAAADGPERDLARRLNIGAQEPVWVAGSTHEGEEEIVLDVYRRLREEFSALKLILAPRHVDRARRVREKIIAAGFSDPANFSEIVSQRLTPKAVILVDVIGELFKIYSLATVVFCGGSLVPRGGQNILEAAAWGKVVCYGPHMEDFPEEAAALEQVGGGIRVTGPEELAAAIRPLLADPKLSARLGQQGLNLVRANRGAAAKYARLIGESLKLN